MICVWSFCFVQLTPTPQMSYCLKSGHSLRLHLVFFLFYPVWWRLLCSCSSLQRCFHVLMAVFTNRTCCVQGLYGCPLAWVHPLCPKYMCNQWPISMYCQNCVCHSSDFSVAACKHNTLNQFHRLEIIIEINFEHFVVGLQKYLPGSNI